MTTVRWICIFVAQENKAPGGLGLVNCPKVMQLVSGRAMNTMLVYMISFLLLFLYFFFIYRISKLTCFTVSVEAEFVFLKGNS